MIRLSCGAVALLLLVGTAGAVEIDEDRKEEIVETVRKLVESHEKGDVTIEPRKAPSGRPAADERGPSHVSSIAAGHCQKLSGGIGRLPDWRHGRPARLQEHRAEVVGTR